MGIQSLHFNAEDYDIVQNNCTEYVIIIINYNLMNMWMCTLANTAKVRLNVYWSSKTVQLIIMEPSTKMALNNGLEI